MTLNQKESVLKVLENLLKKGKLDMVRYSISKFR